MVYVLLLLSCICVNAQESVVLKRNVNTVYRENIAVNYALKINPNSTMKCCRQLPVSCNRVLCARCAPLYAQADLQDYRTQIRSTKHQQHFAATCKPYYLIFSPFNIFVPLASLALLVLEHSCFGILYLFKSNVVVCFLLQRSAFKVVVVSSL